MNTKPTDARQLIAPVAATQNSGMKPNLAVLTAQLVTTDNSIQLLPAGEFRAKDGRPGPGKSWKLDASIAAQVIALAAARANDFVIDYEHQTLHTEANGQPAPAAGWFDGLEWREGQGLYATGLRWTPRAKQMIADQEYRYQSAVFSYDKDGRVLQLMHACLTNNPALDGLDPVAALRFAHQTTTPEESPMDRKELLALLGLPDAASDEQIKTGLAALKAKADSAAGLQAEVASLKAATPDPAKFVSVEVMNGLRNEVAALTARVNGDEADSLIKGALADGRLLPAQEPWAKDLAKTNLAALKQYVETAQPIAALRGQQTDGKQPQTDKPGQLSEVELAICRNLGVSQEAYTKVKA